MKKLLTLVAAAACATAYSSTWHEAWHGSGDSPDLPGTAQVTQGGSALTSIIGSCGVGNDVDMYKIKITTPGSLSISTVGGAGGQDTILMLFDSTGLGVTASDDFTGLESTIDATNVTIAGDYYIAVTRYSRRASNGSGLIWSTFGGQALPNGPGAASPVTSWTNATTTVINYTMTLAGCDPSAAGSDEVDPFFASVTLDASSVYGTVGTTGHVNLTSAAPAGGTTITLSSNNAAVQVPANAFIAAGLTTASFAVTTSSVGVVTVATITGTYTTTNRTAQLTVNPLPANSWIEVNSDLPASSHHGDAADTIAGAQMTAGSGLLLHIYGSTASTSDVDIYCIKITDPANFGATTVGGATLDTQLFLFNPDGTGIVMDDDDETGSLTLQSTLTNQFTGALTVGGTYYLAVTTWDNDPYSATPGEIWVDTPYAVERTPDGADAALPMAAWQTANGSTGNYRVDLVGCSYCAGGEVTIAPTTLTPGPGSSLGGGVAEISTSNDAYYLMRPGAILVATADPLVLVASGTAPGATASSLKAQVEVRSTASNMRQIVEARNFVTNSYDILETFVGTFTAADRTVTLTIPNPNDHIGPGNEVRLRLRYKNQSGVLVYPWQIKFDEVTWRYTP